MDPAVEQRLDRLLGAWAEVQRIRDEESEAIRTAILRTPEGYGAPGVYGAPGGVNSGLDPGWWRVFTTQIADAVVQASTAARQPVHVAYSGV